MKIFGWMQNKLYGKHGSKTYNIVSAANHMPQHHCKEEFSDWPHGLLAIGTFGNSNLKGDTEKTCIPAEDLISSQDLLEDLTPEEEGNLRNEINKILQRQGQSCLATDQEESHSSQLDDQYLSLEADRTNLYTSSPEPSSSSGGRFSRGNSFFISRGKEFCLDKKNRSIGKKSLSFLLKKMFVCRSGFQPIPSFKDPLPSESRMEKILRAILHKKIYPQVSNPKNAMKKYSESRNIRRQPDGEDELECNADDGSKWVKTDSEYIVLEI